MHPESHHHVVPILRVIVSQKLTRHLATLMKTERIEGGGWVREWSFSWQMEHPTRVKNHPLKLCMRLQCLRIPTGKYIRHDFIFSIGFGHEITAAEQKFPTISLFLCGMSFHFHHGKLTLFSLFFSEPRTAAPSRGKFSHPIRTIYKVLSRPQEAIGDAECGIPNASIHTK